MLTGNFDIDDDTYGVIRVDDVEFGESLMNSAELTRTYFLNASIYTYIVRQDTTVKAVIYWFRSRGKQNPNNSII